MHCRATHGPSGQSFDTDAPTDNGGQGEAFSPTDLVATALGACLTTVMGIVATREGLDLDGTRVRVVKEMTSDPVRRIGALDGDRDVPCRAALLRGASRAPGAHGQHLPGQTEPSPGRQGRHPVRIPGVN